MNSPKLLKIIVLSACLGLIFSAEAFSSWPEFYLSSDCFAGSAYGTQGSPAFAKGESNLLVVWEDQRIIAQRDIFATRITFDGDILDPIGIPVCTTSGRQIWVNAAWGDGSYLVVWGDSRGPNSEVYGARIDPQGNVLDAEGFPISTGSGWAACPDVAWDGTNFMVVWSHDRYDTTSYDIYASRVTPEGEVLDPRGIQISFDPAMEFTPSIAYADSVYLVTWEHALG
ncbi:MAG: hypothetical protein GTO24_02525 [candidate division Zixibacteria bacterium]|nr:hypothetical protein [candidate division Zixibacteria bacterium]